MAVTATKIVDKLREQGSRAPGGGATPWTADWRDQQHHVQRMGMLVAAGVIERIGGELVLRS